MAKYCVGDLIRLTSGANVRDGKVLAVNGVLVVVGWTGGGTTEFSALVLERLTSEPDGDDQRQNPCASKRWRDPMGRHHAM